MTEKSPRLDDLKPGPNNTQPLTVARAFTLCELVAYRIRDHATARDSPEWIIATQIAAAMQELERSWRK